MKPTTLGPMKSRAVAANTNVDHQVKSLRRAPEPTGRYERFYQLGAAVLLLSVSIARGQTLAPTISQPEVNGNIVSFITTGSPGDLQFITRSYAVEDPQFRNVIQLASIGANGTANITTTLTPGTAFFQTFTVANPVELGNGSNNIRVISFAQDTYVTNSGTATFMVVAEGTVTNVLEYQWFRNGEAIPGEVLNVLVITNVGPADNESTYYCNVNMLGYPPVRVGTGSIGYPDARLIISADSNPVPFSTPTLLGGSTNGITVLVFPRDTIVTNGGTATFTVEAVGVNNLLPLEYQWYWNDIPIDPTNNPTAATPALIITNVQFSTNPLSTNVLDPTTDVGFYSCDINMIDHPPVRVRSGEIHSPGARLSIYTGSNTTLYAPYQLNSESTCVGSYSGFVRFQSPRTGLYIFYAPLPLPSPTPAATLRDVSALSPSFPRVIWYSNPHVAFCNTSTGPVTFTPNTSAYQFIIYVKGSTFPTGAQFALDVNWGFGISE